MQIRLLMPTIDHACTTQSALSALVDGHLAIDAGGVAYLPLNEQRKVKSVCLTHCHIDHVGGLPLFLENVYQPESNCPAIYASRDTWNTLEQDLFNDRIWPDLERIARSCPPFYRKHVVRPGVPVSVGDLTILPIELEHLVPTLGFMVQGGGASVLLAWDTAPVPPLIEVVRETTDLRAILMDVSFPNRMQWLADKSGHTTPADLQQLAQRISADVRLIAVHLKPAFHDEIVTELAALKLPNLEIGQRAVVYEF